MTPDAQQPCQTCDQSRIGEWDYNDGNLKTCFCTKHHIHVCLDPPVTFDTPIPECHSTRPHTPAHSDEEKIDAAITFACEKHDAAIASTATLAAIEMLSDLNKYSCEEYEEASLSDNEKEMRIHLEYGNRLWGIIRSLRTAQEQQR